MYVLQPRIQDGGKLPKWDPRSRQGQYMGVSPLHSGTVGVIQNLNKNCASHQFHVVYENLLQTVHSSEGKLPSKWTDLIIFDRFRSDFDDYDFVSELDS